MTLWLLFLLLIPLYWLVSLILLCFPNLIWKKEKRPHQPFSSLCESDKVFCIGHRGGSMEGPENTLECFEFTDKVCDMFELDVVETRDKQLVVHHDLTLERTCAVREEVCNRSYADLPCFQGEITLHFSTGKVKTTRNKIILLRDLYRRFPEKPMNIELKSPTPSAVEELNRLTSEFDRESITVWGIVRGDTDALKKRNPNVEHFYSAGSILKVYALYIFGLLPFCCIDYGFFEIPLFTKEALDWIRAIRGDSCLLRLVSCIVSCINCITGPLVRHLKKRGIPTFCFILNSEEDYEFAIDKGVSGIMTDRPTHLKQYLVKRGLNF